MQTRHLVLAAAVAASLGAAQAAAADSMKRKPGLWEMKSTVMGMTNTIRECVGPGTDDMLARQRARGQRADCSQTEVHPTAGGMAVHSVCKMDKRTITTDGVFTGSFDSAFKGHLTSVMDPPQNGMGKTEITMESRHLGACEAGQKPGDVMFQPGMGGGAVNMNDPRIKEMMEKMRKQQGQGQ